MIYPGFVVTVLFMSHSRKYLGDSAKPPCLFAGVFLGQANQAPLPAPLHRPHFSGSFNIAPPPSLCLATSSSQNLPLRLLHLTRSSQFSPFRPSQTPDNSPSAYLTKLTEAFLHLSWMLRLLSVRMKKVSSFSISKTFLSLAGIRGVLS